MLWRFKGKRHHLRFLTYDSEWYPHDYKIRTVGIYDGRRYRRYGAVLDFLRAELTRENRGKIFFAHAGGLADIQFVFDEFIRRQNPSYRLKAIFSGSSAIIVKVRSGHNVWTFCDSLWLLRDKLSKIGASLGLEKGGSDYYCSDYPHCGHETMADGKPTCIFYAPMPILCDYNELDCRILWTAINRLQDELLALGGALMSTIAASAMFLFRAAFLSKDIPTSPKLNTLARDAYIASRVEVIQRNCRNAGYYDINSSFPASMTHPQPGRLVGTGKYVYGGDPCLVRARVTVPVCHIPPLPMRRGERVYFPTGAFERWFTSNDIELLEDSNGRIERIYETLAFEPFYDLGRYVRTIYEMRRRTTDPFSKLLWKYLLNSLYGKFGESTEKEIVLINPKKKPVGPGAKMLMAGVWSVKESVMVGHAHVPIAAHITANSRGLITRQLQAADDVYYCDTDSIVTTAQLPTGDKLGELKLEKLIEKATFLAPKLYRIYPGPEVRAKGFSRLSSEDFDKLEAGNPIEIERMVRVRENLGKGFFYPHEKRFMKRAVSHLTRDELAVLDLSDSRFLRPKRAPDGEGRTRPWGVDELDD